MKHYKNKRLEEWRTQKTSPALIRPQLNPDISTESFTMKKDVILSVLQSATHDLPAATCCSVKDLLSARNVIITFYLSYIYSKNALA